VGKSSLLNRLLRTSRAIVTEFPGTTRDTLEETLNLQGLPLVLVDTAGMAQATADPIERLGIERSRAALAQADLALLVLDASQPLTEADHSLLNLVADKPALVVWNKVDLLDGSPGPLPEAVAGPRWPVVQVSALTGEGLPALEEAIAETVFAGQVLTSEPPLVTSPRHKEALNRALDHVQAAQQAFQADLSPDLVAIDVSAAIHALGEITGQTAGQDLFETIFGRFCIGK
jgi:tRNA modification GTPase